MAVNNDIQNNDSITSTAVLQTSPVADLDTGFPIHNAFATLYREDDGVQ
jgi:hypothetical protein